MAERPLLAYLCSSCGAFGYTDVDFIDSGTTFTCECGAKSVVDLDSPDARKERFDLVVAVDELLGNGADEERWPPGMTRVEALWRLIRRGDG